MGRRVHVGRPAKLASPVAMQIRGSRGVTLVELVVVLVLSTLVIGMAYELFSRATSVERGLGGQLDVLHRGQMASVHLARELRHAVEIFAPPVGLNAPRPYAIFSNDTNQLLMIYVDETHRLIQWNRNTGARDVLATGVERLRVYRKDHRLINYHIRLTSEMSGESLSLLSGICVRNSIN